jgi:phosphoribosylanthranilate isomerase
MQNVRTRVKMCGITRVEDIDAAVRAGADAVGLVFYAESRRCVSIQQAKQLRQAVPAFVSVVALFVNEHPATVRQVQQQIQPDLLQFHGDESPHYCASFGNRYIRAFRVGGPGMETAVQVAQACRPFEHASAWLFDAHSAGYGGSGVSFNVNLLEQVQALPKRAPLVLAGGLKADTVEQAIRSVQPFAVDVSSGIEQEPGIKSSERMAAFMQSVRVANAPFGQ